jgi:ABC-type multidrug transport system ATPase subunit/peptidoglycan/LPS O-acetylase OafA/YrhL
MHGPTLTRTDSERLHALDAVRAFALLAGVVLHTAMSYLPGFTIWPLLDRSTSVPLALTFYVIHIFRMTAFFVIAGFFGRLLLQRHGIREFVRNRSVRILVPLVVGWIVVFPAVVATLAWSRGDGPPPALPAGVERPALAFPLFHLWFLYLLTLLYGMVLALRQGIVERIDRGQRFRAMLDRGVRLAMTSSLMPFALAAPLVGALLALPLWPQFGGIPTPDQSLIPNLPAFVAFGTAFVFGWVLHRQPAMLGLLRRRWPLHLLAAVTLTAACVSMIGLAPSSVVSPLTGQAEMLYATSYALAAWCWTFALLGVGVRFFAHESRTWRYIADASYWIYLAHLPLIFFLQLLVKDLPWHWAVKFPLVLITSLAVLFASYHVLVRFTFVGETLNGRRRGRRGTGTPAESPTPSHDVIAALSTVTKRYGSTLALDGLNLDVRRGELLAVLGPNGAGKSTAISLLLGLQEPDAGSARLFGLTPDHLEARSLVGVMMQEVGLAQELRVRELIDLTTSYYPSPFTVEQTLTLTNTNAIADRPFAKLSAGQKRQAQFALAVCGRPSLLFLDEPTVGLDVQAREMLWTTLRHLVAQGSSIVLTTHYLEEAEALADRVVVLAKGRAIASGTVDEMRSLVARRRVRCITSIDPERAREWPGVVSAVRAGAYLQIVAADADAVVRRILLSDSGAHDLEVHRAGLAEAFTELTQEVA